MRKGSQTRQESDSSEDTSQNVDGEDVARGTLEQWVETTQHEECVLKWGERKALDVAGSAMQGSGIGPAKKQGVRTNETGHHTYKLTAGMWANQKQYLEQIPKTSQIK